MSKRRKSQVKPKNNNWAIFVIGLAFAGGLIALSIFTALNQAMNDSSTSLRAGASSDVVLGTPLQVAAPTQVVGDVSELPRATVTHVDVVYFHRTQRCTACLMAGSFARETVEEFFANQLQCGVISFRELDVEKPENAAIARKYDASGSSLYLGVLMNGVEYLCPVEDIWFYTNNEVLFVSFLKKTLTPLVGGL